MDLAAKVYQNVQPEADATASDKAKEDVKKYTSNNQIYNAFILHGKKDDDFENVGFVSADYVFSQSAMQNNKIPERPYYKIHGILIFAN